MGRKLHYVGKDRNREENRRKLFSLYPGTDLARKGEARRNRPKGQAKWFLNKISEARKSEINLKT